MSEDTSRLPAGFLIGGAVRAMVAQRILENFRGSSALRPVAPTLVDRAKVVSHLQRVPLGRGETDTPTASRHCTSRLGASMSL